MKAAMVAKPIGAGAFSGGCKKRTVEVERREEEKVPRWIPELNMTLYVLPGADLDAVVKRYKEMKEFNKGLLRGNKK